jgi:hypothetical protein
MPTQKFSSNAPMGIAFEIDELIALRAWANDHDIRMTIELECAECEELLAFQAQRPVLQHWVMWRTGQEVIVQPVIGRPRRFSSVNQMIEAMTLVIG